MMVSLGRRRSNHFETWVVKLKGNKSSLAQPPRGTPQPHQRNRSPYVDKTGSTPQATQHDNPGIATVHEWWSDMLVQSAASLHHGAAKTLHSKAPGESRVRSEPIPCENTMLSVLTRIVCLVARPALLWTNNPGPNRQACQEELLAALPQLSVGPEAGSLEHLTDRWFHGSPYFPCDPGQSAA